MTFRQKLLRWWLGANRAALQGGAVAVKSFFGAAGASQIVTDIPALSLQQGLMIFAVAFAYEFFNYLGATPIPDLTFDGRALSPRAPSGNVEGSVIKTNCPNCYVDMEVGIPPLIPSDPQRRDASATT